MTTDVLQFFAMLVVAITTVMLIRAARLIGPVLVDLLHGGPRPPSHPLLANDSRFLNRRRADTSKIG